MKNLLNSVIVLALICVAISSTAYATNLCSNKGYTIGYFEEPISILYGTSKNFEKLKSLYGASYKDEKIKYEYFFTGKSYDTSEFIGTYSQKLEEMGYDLGFGIDQFYELFFFISKGADGVTKDPDIFKDLDKAKMYIYLKYLFKLFPKLSILFFDLTDQINVAIVANMIFNYYNNILPNYKAHYDRMVSLLTERNKMIIVAHGRGALFANKAYMETVGSSTAPYANMKNSVGLIYTAPLASIIHGGYVLNERDYVVSHFRFYFNSMLSSNVDYSGKDMNNHDFAGTYLLDGSWGRLKAMEYLGNLLANLETPPTTGSEGAFTATLTWDGAGDIDLYVTEPDGTKVYFIDKQGRAGFLDVDNQEGNGPEHYYASCDEEILLEGTYKIGANNFRRGNGRIATMQISTYSGGALDTKSLPVLEACGEDCRIVDFFNVNVKKDENGEFDITIQ